MDQQTRFTAGAADWRRQLRKNTQRTHIVVVLFPVMYLFVGFLLDLFIHASGYAQAVAVDPSSYNAYQTIPPSINQVAWGLVTFQIIPWATIVMLGIAAVSLFVTYALYDRVMLMGTEYVPVREDTRDPQAKQLYNVVEEMKVAAGLHYMPRIYLIEADYMNAFASGYSEKSAMVAITRGLLQKLNRAELQAVMAHELSHVRHGDIKLTLTASVLSNLMLMAIDTLFYGVIFSGRRDDRDGPRGMNYLYLVIVLARFILPMVNILLLLYLSRTREYMADAGCVELTRDNGPLISALLKIHGDHVSHADAYAQAYDSTPHENVRREAYLYDPVKMGIAEKRGPSDWFSTHPGLDKRLAALGYKGQL